MSVTILHVSDFHFGHDKSSSGAERKLVLQALLRDLVALGDSWKPDVVCVTGDIGFAGREDDYKEAAVWLRDLLDLFRLSIADLMMCPGNHDADRAIAKTNARPSVVSEADQVLEPLADKRAGTTKIAEQWIAPFARYLEFCGQLGVLPFKLQSFDNYLVGMREHRGIRFVCVNSCWFSKDDSDRNRLFIGLPQLELLQASGQLPDEERLNEVPPTVALMHHPDDWLHDAEKSGIGRVATWDFLCNRVHVLLTGHTHAKFKKPEKRQEAWHFNGGASYASAIHPNFVRLIRLHDCTIEHTVLEHDRDGTNHSWVQRSVRTGPLNYVSAWCKAKADVQELAPVMKDLEPVSNAILLALISNSGVIPNAYVHNPLFSRAYDLDPVHVDEAVQALVEEDLLYVDEDNLRVELSDSDAVLEIMDRLYQYDTERAESAIVKFIPSLNGALAESVATFYLDRFDASLKTFYMLGEKMILSGDQVSERFKEEFEQSLSEEFTLNYDSYALYDELTSGFPEADNIEVNVTELVSIILKEMTLRFAGRAAVSCALILGGRGEDGASFAVTFPAKFEGRLSASGRLYAEFYDFDKSSWYGQPE